MTVNRSPLHRLGVDDLVALNQELRAAAKGLDSMADAAQAITTLLDVELALDDGSPACARRRIASVRSGPPLHDGPRQAMGHRATPLERAAVLAEAAPMVAGLLGQLGIDVDAFLELDPDHLA